MSETHEHHEEHGGEGHDSGHHINYFKIYVTLVILFLISVSGPWIGSEVGLAWITLVTAFGIAILKARLVVNNFMHLKWEKRLMKWMLATSLILMALMVAGVSPDVLNHEGNNWENVSAKEAALRDLSGEHEEGGAEAEGTEVAAADAGAFSAESTFSTICAQCHGQAGDGTGPAGAALDPHPANFTDPTFWETRDRDRIIKVIRDGAASVGGSVLMAPWGALFDEEQLGQMADYVMHFRPEN